MNRMLTARTAALAGLLCALATAASASHITVRVNGERVFFTGTQPQEVRGRVLVPLRGVLEKMGAIVDWDSGSQTVTASRGNMDLRLPVGSRMASLNGQTVELDVPAMTIGGRVMVPLRFVGESLGANVAWNTATRTVFIDTTGAPAREPRAHVGRGIRYVLPMGTVIPARLDVPLSSQTNRTGDVFTATVRSGFDSPGIPDGMQIEGTITEAIPARGGKPGVLGVDFRRAIFPSGETHAMDGSLISLDDSSVARSSSGYLVSKKDPNKDRLKWVGIGAGAGLVIGALTKQNTLLSVLLGAGAGYLYGQTQARPHNVNLGAGTEFGVRLDRQFAFTSEETIQ